MELKIEQVAIPEKIAFNYEELKQWAADIAEEYKSIAYTGGQLNEMKKDRADLNRGKKALNDERIRREKEYMKPFDEFKKQINEVISIIDSAAVLIDRQVKECEEELRKEKKGKISEYFSSSSYPEWLTLSMIWDDKWLNASVSMKSIQAEIDSRIATVENDLATLSELPEFAFEAIETYKTTLDLNKSIAEGHRLSEMQKRKAEQERIKAEQEKVRAEQEKLRKEQKEERTRLAAMVTPEEIAESVEAYREAANVGGVHMSEELPTYVCFKALLTVAQAVELKEFFESRNIEFSRI